jgi:hypothetical protein
MVHRCTRRRLWWRQWVRRVVYKCVSCGRPIILIVSAVFLLLLWEQLRLDETRVGGGGGEVVYLRSRSFGLWHIEGA